MTIRDRRLARAERLNDWADKRDAKASAALDRVHAIADQIPFGQPILVGHHSEGRARRDQDRIQSGMQKVIENEDKAASMRSRAANIESAAQGAIYSDDPDAIEALESRIAKLEAERETIKAFNASCRKGAPDWSLLTEWNKKDLLRTAEVAAFQVTDSKGNFRGYPSYHLTNLSGNIKRNKDRLEAIKIDQRRAQRCENAGGLAVEPAGSGYVCVTFADKPKREIIDALKGAGFYWRRGSWWGKAEALPDLGGVQ